MPRKGVLNVQTLFVVIVNAVNIKSIANQFLRYSRPRG